MDKYLAIYTPVAELANRIDLGNKNRLTLNPTTELNSFKQMLQSIDIPADELSNLVLDGTLGNYRLALNGQAVNIVRGVEDLRYNANLLNFLKRLGLTRTATAQAKEAEIKTQYAQNATGLHQTMRMKNRIRIAKEIRGRYGKSPRNAQELEAILNRDANLKGIFDAFLQQLRGSYADPNAKPYGDWVRKQYRPSTYNLSILFNIINRHKSSIGGCWAVRADGYKCLAPSLSCSPIKGQSQYKCSRSPDNRCGPDKQQRCYRCLKWNANNTCAEAPRCEARKACSKSCSNREIEVPSDTVLICIKRKFWIAAQDYMNRNFTMAPGPAPSDPPGEVTDDEPDDEDADKIPDEEDEPIIDERPLSATLADFFGSTWLIWVIGFIIIGIVVYRGMRRY